MSEAAEASRLTTDFQAYAEAYRRDGVVFIPRAFDAAAMTAIEAAFDWKFARPQHGALSAQYVEGDKGMFITGGNSLGEAEPFLQVMRDTPAADIVAALFGSPDVWYFGEQLFCKKGGHVPRTPWHQDAPYLKWDGEKSAVMWVALNDLPREACLEVVRGSHRGPLYNGSTFAPEDATDPIFLEGDLPRLPDIEKAREDYDIAGWPVRRGDVLIFHARCLHGGAPVWPGVERRSISFRFVGDDVVRAARPRMRDGYYEAFTAPAGDEGNASLEAAAVGTPLYDLPGFQRVRPWRGRASA